MSRISKFFKIRVRFIVFAFGIETKNSNPVVFAKFSLIESNCNVPVDVIASLSGLTFQGSVRFAVSPFNNTSSIGYYEVPSSIVRLAI